MSLHRYSMRWILILALGLSGSAFAQDLGSNASGPALKVETTEKISDKDKLTNASAILEQLQSILKHVLKSLEEARTEKDVVKLNCVNEKLTQIKGLLRVAEQSDISLQEAVAKGDEESAEHEYAKLTIAKQRAQQLQSDAEQCIGQLAYIVDERTIVTVETPDDLPDAVTNPPVFTTVGVNPPALSPTQ